MSAALQDILRLIPGYDPFATAGECWLDEDAALKAIGFFPDCLKHIEGKMAGKPFVLEPWQQAIVGNLFGWKRLDGTRRYREGFLYVPRKNGKSPLAGGIAAYMLFCDPEVGQQNYIAARDRDQASMLFRQTRGMVEQNDRLMECCEIFGGNAQAGQAKSIIRPDRNSFLKVISADSGGKHGGTSHLVIVDELHEQPNRNLVDVLKTSIASENRPQPMMLYLTTADFDRPSICNEKHDYACKVQKGVIPDESFLPVIYEAARDADWKSPALWEQVNPNLGVSVSRAYIERECKIAQETPAYENTFKRLHLNMKTQSDVRWLRISQWDECRDEHCTEGLDGEPCFVGADLGSTGDLTALVLVFPRDDGRMIVQPHFWVPEDSARERELRDHVPYPLWIKEGHIHPTGGDTTDYDVLRRDINMLGQQYAIQQIAADYSFQGVHLCAHLQQDGFSVVRFGQGFNSMAAPTRRLEELIRSKQLVHDGNPVLRWMADNIAVEQNGEGHMRPCKKKSTERIDGIVSLIMAIGVASQTVISTSVYEQAGNLAL